MAFNIDAQKYKYQGKEKHNEFGLGWFSFDLRAYNPVIARWHNADPYNQFSSPYIAMGNNPVNMVDPDGGRAGGTTYEPEYNADANYNNYRDVCQSLSNNIIAMYSYSDRFTLKSKKIQELSKVFGLPKDVATDVVNSLDPNANFYTTSFAISTVTKTAIPYSNAEKSEMYSLGQTAAQGAQGEKIGGIGCSLIKSFEYSYGNKKYSLTGNAYSVRYEFERPYGTIADGIPVLGSLGRSMQDAYYGDYCSSVINLCTSAAELLTLGSFSGSSIASTSVRTTVVKSASSEGLEFTAHGSERIAGAAATRGGVLSVDGINATKSLGRSFTQADGANVFLHEFTSGRFNAVIQNQNTGRIITTMENWSLKSINRIGKNYGWPIIK